MACSARPANRDQIVGHFLFSESPGKTQRFARSVLRHRFADVQQSILCDRCHDLVHHHRGESIYHPDLESIRDTIEESPHKYNHVYHLLDAADFPMSLMPRLHQLLDLMPLRSQNRRARHGKFFHNQKTEMSFIVTRSDLLAPRKDQVDKLMPWIRDTLRDALGREGRNVRLGNVRCVSGKRNWWTSELREEIWRRGGANWLVGKANVGKSYLFLHVFPKGRMADAKRPGATTDQTATVAVAGAMSNARLKEALMDGPVPMAGEPSSLADVHNNSELLPPPQPETNYPQMPVVSALPGTTASPIRIPFGGGKGELIDLPGLTRSGLGDFVQPEHRGSLVMKSRIQPEQTVLKGHWDSLLLGGLIRLTPRTENVVFLTYNFTPLTGHRTMTQKAIGIQAQDTDVNVTNIAVAGTGERTKLAGSFALKYDVTKPRTGPITRKDAANIKVDRLPYRVCAIDILIEGCGWVEVVAQVRTKDLYRENMDPAIEAATDGGAGSRTMSLDMVGDDYGKGETVQASRSPAEPDWPVIDVFSPEGRFIACRRPANAWLLCRKKPAASLRSRPRRSMKGVKKLAKQAARAAMRQSQ